MQRLASVSVLLASLLLLVPATTLALGGCEGSSSASGPSADAASAPATSTDSPGRTDAAAADSIAVPRDGGTQAAPADAADTPAAAAPETPAPWRLELLDDAFAVATMLPSPLHEKDRARAQQAVITAMLALDRSVAARPMIDRIPGWRRGDAMADLAFHLAERGRTDEVPALLQQAEWIAESAEGWRRDRIRVNVARTHALLGRDAVAAGMETAVVPSEAGLVDAVRTRLLEDEAFDAQLAAFEAVVAIGDFDRTRNVLAAAVELYERFYDDADRRARTRAFITASWSALPVDIRIARLMDLADIALRRGDPGVARSIVEQARTMLDGVRMTAEGWVPLSAEVARRRGRLGDIGPATSALEDAIARYEAERRTIIDMFRADVLRPVAEAYADLGDAAAARRVYRLALDEGALNPNARPRARDLSATLSSMAVHDLQPDETLAARIAEIRGGLEAPW